MTRALTWLNANGELRDDLLDVFDKYTAFKEALAVGANSDEVVLAEDLLSKAEGEVLRLRGLMVDLTLNFAPPA